MHVVVIQGCWAQYFCTSGRGVVEGLNNTCLVFHLLETTEALFFFLQGFCLFNFSGDMVNHTTFRSLGLPHGSRTICHWLVILTVQSICCKKTSSGLVLTFLVQHIPSYLLFVNKSWMQFSSKPDKGYIASCKHTMSHAVFQLSKHKLTGLLFLFDFFQLVSCLS